MNSQFRVEGRYFEQFLHAFTFAQIQADRMERPVSITDADFPFTHNSVAYPPNHQRKHVT